MTAFLLILIALTAVLALRWELNRRARVKATMRVLHTLRAQVDTYLTLSGALCADQDKGVWTRPMSKHAFTYRVTGDPSTGQVEVTCFQWDGGTTPAQQVSLRLKGSAHRLNDTIPMADEANRFVQDCFAQYVPAPDLLAPMRDLGRGVLGLLDRLTFAPRIRK